MTNCSYSLGFRTFSPSTLPTNAAAFPLFEIRTSPTDRANLMFCTMSNTQMNAGGIYWFGIGQPAAAGVIPLTTYSLQPDDPGDPVSNIVVATDWTVPPTIPAQFFRRFSVTTSAFSCIRDFALVRGLMIPPNSSFAMWLVNPAAYGTEWNISMILDQ